MMKGIKVLRISEEADRQQALTVMRAIYRDEKSWVQRDDRLVAAEDLGDETISWFVACHGDQPVGVVRVLYQPPLGLYKAYAFQVKSSNFDLEAFIRNNRIAEIGRFAILPDYRRNVRVAAGLMNAAARDTIERDFTHYITDVFEGETHSPYDFHSKVIGFEVVATHDTGELNCPCRRITMMLDLRRAYRRLRAQNNWAFRALTMGWPLDLQRKLVEQPLESVAS